MDVGAVVRRARTEAGLTQRQLAKQVRVPAETVSRIESGAREPSLRMLDRLLAACGRDLQLQLVQRHADLDRTLAEWAAQPLEHRLQSGGRVHLLPLLTELGRAGLVVGGAWAVALHGLPPEAARGRVWARDDLTDVGEPAPGSARGLAAVLRPRGTEVQQHGRWWGVGRAELLLAEGATVWRLHAVGEFEVVLLTAGQPSPSACWAETPRGPVLVRPLDALTVDDGVRADVLERALRRSTAA